MRQLEASKQGTPYRHGLKEVENLEGAKEFARKFREQHSATLERSQEQPSSRGGQYIAGLQPEGWRQRLSSRTLTPPDASLDAGRGFGRDETLQENPILNVLLLRIVVHVLEQIHQLLFRIILLQLVMGLLRAF